MYFLDNEELKKRKESFKIDNGLINLIDYMNKKLKFDNNVKFEDKYPNIFIFGIQRSGTTLLNQLIAKYSNLGYINNLTARFWENPRYGIALSKSLNLCNKNNITFRSVHGNTEEIDNVHEFGYFWASLLKQKSAPDLRNRNLEQINWELLKNKILSINYAFNNGCVFKNTLIGHYLKGFNGLFKYPLFIYIKRDYLDIAMSILKVRKQRYGDVKTWWSMKPKEYEKIKDLNVYEQIVAQIFYLEKDIEEQIKYIDKSQILFVNYDDLCKNPQLVFHKIKQKFNDYGFDFDYDLNNVSLYHSKIIKITEEVMEFKKYIGKYFNQGKNI